MSDKSPDAYRTISEAGEEAGLPPHVLRFWESKFAQLKPVKRAGGRRMYRRQDVLLLKGLRRLLYDDGYTIKGAQKYLREHGVAVVAALADAQTPSPDPAQDLKPTKAESEPQDSTAPPDQVQAAQTVTSTPATMLSASQIDLAKRALTRLEQARERLTGVLQKSA
ncbi:MerR family transcriptional regulator [Oceanicaulis sp. MMSF_3324]|uniref:MerR family transcriptional regulator n=1 Tax=Oceanicaulis sp. MMSF_3324 TaxID=3046702 RepID=UPI00273EDACF|nr:MerR family transcriptional regulator [Oceanicaulis sp. MMSF_3324]